jgi:hypothetical protein
MRPYCPARMRCTRSMIRATSIPASEGVATGQSPLDVVRAPQADGSSLYLVFGGQRNHCCVCTVISGFQILNGLLSRKLFRIIALSQPPTTRKVSRRPSHT